LLATAVTGISDAPADGVLLLGGRIELPIAGSETDRSVLPIAGWAVGAAQRVVGVELIGGGRTIGSWATGRWSGEAAAEHRDARWSGTSGYAGEVSTLDLGEEFELELRAILEDGSTAPLGRISGESEPLDSGYEPVFQPLFVTTFGRTGSTVLMHLLAQFDEVVCGMNYPHELRIGKYFLHQFELGTGPANHDLSVNRDNFADSGFWGGRNPFADGLESPALDEWFETDHLRESAAFAQQQIDGAYSALSQRPLVGDALSSLSEPHRAAGAPLYFAEKSGNDRLVWLAHRLYRRSRELILVRDFRDVYCSVAAFNATRGYERFGRAEATDERDYIRRLGGAASYLYEAWRGRSRSSMLVRYEELVTDPVSVVLEVRRYLGVAGDDEPARAAAILAAARATEQQYVGQHATTESPQASIGRWRRDLPPDLHSAVIEYLDGPLVGFGYEPTL
jgi:sulfotransferase family protein